jgi:hypothetical protein
MFIIPGFLIALLTFPGVIVHEAAHRLFCDLAGVPVYQVRYFRPFRNPAGYVIHAHTDKLGASFLITIGPLIVNTLLCALLTFGAVIPIVLLEDHTVSPVFIVLFWVGLSVGMHAIPSTADARSFLDATRRGQGNFVLIGFAWVLVGLLTVINLLRFFWIDAIYAIVVSLALPFATGLV